MNSVLLKIIGINIVILCCYLIIPIITYNNAMDTLNIDLGMHNLKTNGSEYIGTDNLTTEIKSKIQELDSYKGIIEQIMLFGWLIHAAMLLFAGMYSNESLNKKSYKWTALIIAIIGFGILCIHIGIGIASWGGSGLI